MSFLQTSTLSLKTTEGQMNDSLQRSNICNPDRIIDIVTLYLARSLGLNTADIKENFVFEKTKTYEFPDSLASGPYEIFPPNSSLTDFPDLEQTYWSILSQYSPITEPSIRQSGALEILEIPTPYSPLIAFWDPTCCYLCHDEWLRSF